jgi:PAS domain S-box-containing protein
MSEMRPPVPTRLAVGSALAIASLILNAVITYSSLRALLDSWHSLTRTHDVLVGLDAVLSDLSDAETGQRGYLLTGDESYLEPYRRALALVDADLNRLQVLTADDVALQGRVAGLRSKAAEKLAELRETIALRRKEGLEPALRVVASGRGKALMDDLRAQLGAATGEANRIRDRLLAESPSDFQRTVVTFSAISVLALALLCLMHFLNQQNQAALRDSEQWLSTTLQSIGQAVIATDREGRVLFLNRVARSLTGREPGDATGQPLEQIFPVVNEQTREPVDNPVRKVFHEGTVVALANETALIAKDGREVPIEASASPISDGRGRTLGVVLVFHDVTERRRAEDTLRRTLDELERRVEDRTRDLARANQGLRAEIGERRHAEEALRASEERFRSMVESVKDYAIFMLDPGGHVAAWNAGAELIKGYRAEEIIGRHFSCFYTADDLARGHPARELEVAAAEGRCEDEGWRVRRDGSVFRANVIITALRNGGGQLLGYSKVTRDVTERRAAEENLKDFAARLERSNRELQDFASVASHDLQEPLRKIQAFGDRLHAKYAEALGDQGRDYLERMQAAAARMRSLINDLLNFSRVATKAQPFSPVDLGQVALEVLSDLEGRIEQTGARVEVDGLPTVQADPMQMRQLLQNLIGNALKFHRPGEPPIVQVAGRVIEAPEGDATASQPRCEIAVRDNGIGFDEKYLDRIFGVFQRLHGRGEYEGTGMGLAICRKIVERHGGSITARSTPVRGATFLVTLPLSRGNDGEMS